MKIFGIQNRDLSQSQSFKAKPDKIAMQIYAKSLQEGLGILNKRVDIIIHNSTAPSVRKEDVGIGSLFSRTVQNHLIPFLKLHGFSGIQQEPNNLRQANDPSPYAPESSAKNIFMIPLEKLTTKAYDCILPKAVFDSFVIRKPNGNDVNYSYVLKAYNSALGVAYNIMYTKAKGLSKEFAAYKNENESALLKSAIYRVLNNKYKTYWQEWEGIDKKLFAPNNEQEAKLAENRIAQIKEVHKKDIDFFMFQQFLIDKENKNSNKLAQESGIKIIGDSPVASPSADEWINQNLFLQGKAIGCPPDYFAKDGQRWGFKYFNPKYIFNPDGTLGKAGQILKAKYDQFFSSFPGGLRIDHVIGLVDPFIYTVKDKKMTSENSGRIYSIPGEFQKKPEEYSNILEKIILQSAKDHGMNKADIICEDLGEPNPPTQKVMKDLGLSGIAVTQFDYRGKDQPERNVIMIGSHDNPSFLEYTDNLFKEAEGKNIERRGIMRRFKDAFNRIFRKKQDNELAHFMRKTKYLAQDTAPMNATKKEIRDYTQRLRTDKKSFMEASYAELFTSPAKRVQIFFADFWGLGKTYNRPSTIKGNWTLRIPQYFESEYYDAVSKGKAPNMAKAVATALRHRGLDAGNEKLLNDLDNSAKILDK